VKLPSKSRVLWLVALLLMLAAAAVFAMNYNSPMLRSLGTVLIFPALYILSLARKARLVEHGVINVAPHSPAQSPNVWVIVGTSLSVVLSAAGFLGFLIFQNTKYGIYMLYIFCVFAVIFTMFFALLGSLLVRSWFR
jgi:hypothetical protein